MIGNRVQRVCDLLRLKSLDVMNRTFHVVSELHGGVALFQRADALFQKLACLICLDKVRNVGVILAGIQALVDHGATFFRPCVVGLLAELVLCKKLLCRVGRLILRGHMKIGEYAPVKYSLLLIASGLW